MVVEAIGGSTVFASNLGTPEGERFAMKEGWLLTTEWIVGVDAFECRVFLEPEEDGGYSVYAPSLPGLASQGETEAEAIANITEAFQGTLAVYKEGGQEVPWLSEPIARPQEAKERWIVVNA